MATDAFISYCRENSADAERVCSFLEQNNVSCWMAPRNIPGGMEWPEAIVEGIRGSRIMLVLLSEHTQRSKQIGRELTLASDNDLTVITVRLDNVPAPDRLQYFTSNLQWIDAFGECFGPGMAKLLATLRYQLGKPQIPVTPKVPISQKPAQTKGKPTVKRVVIASCFVVFALGMIGYLNDQGNHPNPNYTPEPDRQHPARTTMDENAPPNTNTSSPAPAPVDNAALLSRSTAGVWAGTYVCGGFTNQAQLSLVAEGNGGMHGVLQFNAVPRPGSYYVKGIVNPADSSVFLKYAGWLYRPPGDWIPLDVQAQVDVADGVMQGRMNSGLCTAFELRKIQ